MQWGAVVVTGGLFAVLLVGSGTPSAGQGPEPSHQRAAEEPDIQERDFHPNHFGGLVGLSRHLDAKDTAFTLGLDYTRRFTRRWALTGYVESVSNTLERDIIVAAAAIFYVMPRWSVLLGPGLESAATKVTADGETEEESELQLMLRAGTAHGFPLTPSAALGPALFIDWVPDRWTVVLGLATVAGF